MKHPMNSATAVCGLGLTEMGRVYRSASDLASEAVFLALDDAGLDKSELDGFVEAMKAIRQEMLEDPEVLRSAPHTLPVRRLDDVKAARELNLAWSPS